MAFPFLPHAVNCRVKPDAALLRELVAFGGIIADADDQFFAAIAVQVGTPYAVAPTKLLVDEMAFPNRPGHLWRGVDHDLVAVPGFNRRDELIARAESFHPQFPHLDLARSS